MQLQIFQMTKSRNIFRLLKLPVFFIAIVLLDHGVSLAAQAGKNPSGACQLNSDHGSIEHVIFLIFDNVHFLRDNPNVPSDLEQMPNLLNFIRGNGTLLTNNHTVLISHTANGILTNLTGMYSDRHGQSVANSYRYFKPDGTTLSSSSFKYWTDLVDDTGTPPADPLPNMVNADSGTPKNAPAPWVPYTRAGCDFGAVALANIVLENTSTGANGDITKVFGVGLARVYRGAGIECRGGEHCGAKPCSDGLCRPRDPLWEGRRDLRQQRPCAAPKFTNEVQHFLYKVGTELWTAFIGTTLHHCPASPSRENNPPNRGSYGSRAIDHSPRA